MTTEQRLDEFFRCAVPLHAIAGNGRAVMYWCRYGAIVRVAIIGDEVLTDLVEPDTPEMDELVCGAGADAVIDGIMVERLRR
jgi:hypothetical protein